jgi:protein-disulfide isomerase
MKIALAAIGGIVVGGAIGYGVATRTHATAVVPGSSIASSTPAVVDKTPLFELDGQTYGENDLPSDVRAMAYEARSEEHERLEALLTQFALRLSLAREKDKTVKPDALPPLDQLLGATPPTEDEIKQLYEQNKARLPQGMTYEQVKPEIEKFVVSQKQQGAINEKLDALRSGGKLKMLLPEPQAPVVALDLKGFPAKGLASATLVEVSDYLCPHCQQSLPEVEATVKELGDKIKFVQVDYPLNPDGLSGQLARGGFCAQQQGDEAFWKYHEAAFKTAIDKGWKTSDPTMPDPFADIATTAGAGLDAAKLVACADSPEAKGFVSAAVDQFQKAGVNGTPSFFLNGRKLNPGSKGLKDAVTAGLAGASH